MPSIYTDTENVARILDVVPVSVIISDMPGEGMVAEKFLWRGFHHRQHCDYVCTSTRQDALPDIQIA